MRPFLASILSAVLVIAVAFGLTTLAGCATTPTQQGSIAVLVDAAVAAAVQNGNPSIAVQTERAVKVKQIATQLQALDKGTVAALPEVAGALKPLLAVAGLNPADTALAMLLVNALEGLVAQYAATSQTATQATAIQMVLSDVIAATAAYGAP